MVRLWGYKKLNSPSSVEDKPVSKATDSSTLTIFGRKKIIYSKLVDDTPASKDRAPTDRNHRENVKLASSEKRRYDTNCQHQQHINAGGTERNHSSTDFVVRVAHYAPNCNSAASHNPESTSQQPLPAKSSGNRQQSATSVAKVAKPIAVVSVGTVDNGTVKVAKNPTPPARTKISQRICEHRRHIRKFMKGLLRQRLDSIAGKVLAVASAAVDRAASPVKKRRPVVPAASNGPDREADVTANCKSSPDRRTVTVNRVADDVAEDAVDDDDDDDDDAGEDERYVQVQQHTPRILVINNNLSCSTSSSSNGHDVVDHPPSTPHHRPHISNSCRSPPSPTIVGGSGNQSNTVGSSSNLRGAGAKEDGQGGRAGKVESIDNRANQFDGGMQDIRLRVERTAGTNHHGSPNHQQQPQQQQQQHQQQHQHHHSPQHQTHQHNNNSTVHLQSPAKQQQQQQPPTPQPRPMHLFTNPNLNCDNSQHQPQQQNNHLLPHQQNQQQPQQQQQQPQLSASHQQQQQQQHYQQQQQQHHHHHHHSNIQSRSPSSEEDNSPTEMNNCRRLIDKPPLVKRLTMGLLRSTEDSRPLVHNNACSPTSDSTQTISDGYVNEAICEADLKLISAKFGDSCRKSLTSVMDKTMMTGSLGDGVVGGGVAAHDGCEFDFKKNFLRETSSANSSPKIFAPSAPRFDTLLEHQELKGAPWFQAGLPREISLEVLSRQSPGAFLVRQSSTKPGCFALSLRVPPPAPKVAHYLILKTLRGYKIKGFTKEFTSLRALITHHSVMPELLPVPLALARPQNIIPQRRHPDDFDTYGSLNDFRKMMSDMNV